MLERSFLLPVAKKSDWQLSSNFTKKDLSLEELKALLINIIEGLYNNFSQNIDHIIEECLKNELNLEIQNLLLEILLLTNNFVQIWHEKLKEKRFLERHGLKIKYNYFFNNLISKECLNKITPHKFTDSLLKYCYFSMRGLEYKTSYCDLKMFIKYVFFDDVLLDWSEKINKKRKNKNQKIDFSVLENKKEKENDSLSTVLHLQLFYLEDIKLSDFFIKALAYEKEFEKIILNLKSHELLLHYINKITDKNIIHKTYNEDKISTYNLFKNIDDEECLKKFIIRNKCVFLSDLLFEKCNIFDDLYVQALLICENQIDKQGKLVAKLLKSCYLQLFLKKVNIFEKICISLSERNLDYEIILNTLDFDDTYLEKIIIFKKYFPFSQSFSEKFTFFLENYFEKKPFTIQSELFYNFIFQLRKENFLKKFYKFIIKENTFLFLSLLFKEEIFDGFFVDTLILICNLCDEEIVKEVKNLLSTVNFKENCWDSVIKKYLILFYYKRYGTFYNEDFMVSPLNFTKQLFLDKSGKQSKEYPTGLVFNNSLLSIKLKNDFTVYLVINTFSIYNANFITFVGDNTLSFEILNERIVLKDKDGYLMFPQDKTGSKKLISFEKKQNNLKIHTGKFTRTFPISSVNKILIGESFHGIVERVLVLENVDFSKNVFKNFLVDKLSFYDLVIRKLERKMSYYNTGGVYIDSLVPYFINKNELEVDFVNVLYNDNFTLAEVIEE